MRITNTEFVKAVAGASGHTQKDVKEVMSGIQDALVMELSKATEEEPVEISVLTTLVVGAKYAEAHKARNPQTGEIVTAPGKYRVKARVTGAVKDAINK